MNVTERESIILNTAWQVIDSMVNPSMFEGFREDAPTTIRPETRKHSVLFVILLRDFLSEVRASGKKAVPLGLLKPPDNARPTDRTFIFHLRQVCKDPSLGPNVELLQERTEAFADWLEGSFEAEGVNLAEIGVVCDLRVERYEYLQICGDIAKHSLPRLSIIARRIRNLLGEAGHTITEEESFRAIPSFFDRFFNDSFEYSTSRIAEFLNEIRWAIFEYLVPHFEHARHSKGGIDYDYHVPREIEEPVARAMYRDLMNRVRAKPWIPRFVVDPYLKKRH